MKARLWLTVTLLAVSTLGVVACDPGAAVTNPAATSAPTEAMAPTLLAPSRTSVPTSTLVSSPVATPTVPSPRVVATPTASIPPGVASRTITVTMINYGFLPAELRVRAGETVRLHMENADNITHAIAIPAAGFSEAVRPGDTRVVDFAVNLPPGSYYLYCPVLEEGNHEELGMVGTLIVEAAP